MIDPLTRAKRHIYAPNSVKCYFFHKIEMDLFLPMNKHLEVCYPEKGNEYTEQQVIRKKTKFKTVL